MTRLGALSVAPKGARSVVELVVPKVAQLVVQMVVQSVVDLAVETAYQLVIFPRHIRRSLTVYKLLLRVEFCTLEDRCREPQTYSR